MNQTSIFEGFNCLNCRRKLIKIQPSDGLGTELMAVGYMDLKSDQNPINTNTKTMIAIEKLNVQNTAKSIESCTKVAANNDVKYVPKTDPASVTCD
jgi:hypothetical protein